MGEALPLHPLLAANVRLRPVPELGGCLAYVPGDAARRPALHLLNPTSWLIAALCDGRPLASLRTEVKAGSDTPEGELDAGIAELVRLGVIDTHSRQTTPISDDQREKTS